MSRLRSESGFTLVELLVTVVILTIILGAGYGALDAFQRQSTIDNGRGDNQDAVRRTVDGLAQGLRGVMGTGTAAAIDRAAANDIVFRVVDPAIPPVSGGANTARLMFRRYCVDASAQLLYEETLHWTSPSPPGLPSTACPGTGWDSIQQLADHVTTAGGAIFSYSPDPAVVSRVGLDLSIDRDAGRAPAATRLRSAVTLRNLASPPTVNMTCQPVGGGQVICDAFGSADPDGGALAYAWSYGSGQCPTALTALPANQPQLNQAGLTPGSTYCFSVTATDPTGLSASSDPQTVTVQ